MCEKWSKKEDSHIMGRYDKMMTGKIESKQDRKELKKAGIKIWSKKVVMGSLDLKASMKTKHDASNLKRWDVTTSKTSNRGLTANTSYIYSDDYKNYHSWTFGGIKSGDLEIIMKKNNINYKGMKYGEMAMKLMKLD